jgi:Undecaprenyl-phosphate galactose phosphotransferase WbaP
MTPEPLPEAPTLASARIEAVPGTPSRVSHLREEVLRAVAIVLLAGVDWLAVAGCIAFVWVFRENVLRPVFPTLPPVILPMREYFRTLYFLLPWIIAFAEAGLYSSRPLFWEEARRALRACTLAAVFAALVAFATHSTVRLSRMVLVGVWLTTIVVVPVARHYAKRVLAAIGLWRRRVLILGAGDTGRGVRERIAKHRVLGYQPVAFVDDAAATLGPVLGGLPVVGPLAEVPRFVRAYGASEVLVALPRLPRERLLQIISLCEGQVGTIRLVPDMFGLATLGVEAEDLDGVLLLHMRWNLAKPWNLAIKRIFDLVVGAIFTVLLLPLVACIAIAIKLDTPGPVLFRQERLGRSWSRFSCLKFRTMYLDAPSILERWLNENPRARAEWEQYAKLRGDDPRCTRVGRFLRRTSLDELPQLFNVLRGQMSLVGPRPYLPSEAQRMGALAETILKAPPGITGLWQVSCRNQLSFEQRLRLDEYYVRNWSLWQDVIVLLKTVGVLVTAEGAY